jgi:LmbE family N-acetylglucosaminyl deacetylase
MFRRMLWLLLPLAWNAAAAERPQLGEPGPGDRVLVVAPHPDDATLGCAGYVQRAVARGATVGLVWMTAGDGFTIDAILVNRHLRQAGSGMIHLGLTRIQEALAAAGSLGVPRDRQYVLGYPDGGLAALLSSHYDEVYVSPHTRSAVVPYGEAMSFGQSVTGRNVERDLHRVFAEFRPTIVFAPHASDIHPDHAQTGELTAKLLAQRGQLHSLHRYVIHAHGHYPSPRGLHRELPLDPPAALAALPWNDFPLTPAEQDGKLRALKVHATQWKVMAPYLESFVRRNELFVTDQARAD